MKRLIRFLNHEDIQYLWLIPITLITLPIWAPIIIIALILSTIICGCITAWEESK